MQDRTLEVSTLNDHGIGPRDEAGELQRIEVKVPYSGPETWDELYEFYQGEDKARSALIKDADRLVENFIRPLLRNMSVEPADLTQFCLDALERYQGPGRKAARPEIEESELEEVLTSNDPDAVLKFLAAKGINVKRSVAA